MNIITDEVLAYVAALSRLEVAEEEKEGLKKDLSEILSYMDKLNQLDTSGIDAMSHVVPLQNVFREDVVIQQDNRDDLLSNAPAQKEHCYRVPKTVE